MVGEGERRLLVFALSDTGASTLDCIGGGGISGDLSCCGGIRKSGTVALGRASGAVGVACVGSSSDEVSSSWV